MSTAKRIARRILQASEKPRGATRAVCPECGTELEEDFGESRELLCGLCYRTWPRSAPPSAAR